jgi:hypothetical protein
MPPRNEAHGKSLQRYSSVSPQEETARATYQRQIAKATRARLGRAEKRNGLLGRCRPRVFCDPSARAKRLRRVAIYDAELQKVSAN